MPINFTNLNNTTPVEVVPSSSGFSLNLEKNNLLNLTKAAPEMKHVKFAASWDVSTSGVDFDLDISAFMLDQNQKLTDASNVIFYNNKTNQGISLDKDNRTGIGEGDDETINVDFSSLSNSVSKIVFCITIDKAVERRQTFGMVRNAKVRVVNADNNKEICTYTLATEFSTDTAVIIGAFNRDGNSWNFQTIGEGFVADLNVLASRFM